MKQWTRSSRCIFCQFRSGQNHHILGSSRHVHYASSVQLKENSPEYRDSRRESPRKAPLRRIDFRRDTKDTIPSAERRREIADEKSAQIKDAGSRRNEILRALRRTRAFYMSSRMSKTSEMSQMEGLDPGGVLWPQFESLIKAAVDSTSPSKKHAGFLGELMSMRLDEFRPNVEREVQFAFLDYVLDHTDATKTTSVDAMDMRYPTEWYQRARQMQRVIHLHVGPTNSGKTYTALKRLEQARNGFYAGPLRLLAHEVYSRFNSRGIKCDLVTGDDVRLDNSGEVQLYASTVEMVDAGRVCDVGVVDEIQMMGDAERGWAWTRAVLGAQVKELHLCGESRVVPLIREIVASMGDTLHIHQYERLNPLKVMSRSLKGNLQNLRKGDCVVAFSIMHIHALKRQIELDTGKRCAIIYGGLPPETRAQQAALFNDPDNDYDYLAASDAIGMGLNLSIKRIVFETTRKYNGVFHERLSIPQMKQIAGRAGRYRTARDDSKNGTVPDTRSKNASQNQEPQTIGLVTCLDEADLPILQHALSTEGAPLKAAGVLPPGEFYEDLASRLPENTPFEFILRRMSATVSTHDRFRLCDIRDQLQIARSIEVVENLSIGTRLTMCAAPASWRGTRQGIIELVLLAIAKAVASETPVTVADIDEIPLEVLDEPMTSARSYLESLETLHKSLILYLWLSYRFPRALRDQDMAVRAKELCEGKINTTLLKFSANPKLSQRLAEIRKSSEMLREQARERGASMATPLIMNPDQTVEEVDSARLRDEIENQKQRQDDDPRDVRLERQVEVEGELDLGRDEGQTKEILDAGDQVDGSNVQQFRSDEEPQQVGGSG